MSKVVTREVRFSFPHVFEPSAMEGQKPKYSVSLIIPKSDTATLSEIQAAINNALEVGKASKFGGKIPPVWKNPLRDGDAERPDDPAYKDSFFVNANSDNAPGVVDAQVKPIMDRQQFYAGCYGRAGITFYAFNSNGNKGIACGLQNVQKLRDGERLSGGSTAEEDFGAPAPDNFAQPGGDLM
jgi:hypothetical protein